MAQPVKFQGCNGSLGAPEGHEETVQALPCFRNGQQTISCWELTAGEFEEIQRTGRVYLSVWFGLTSPPVYVGSERTVRAMCADAGVWDKKTPPEGGAV